MSRIIVKGLPKYFTENNIREHFSKAGDVTDVKLMKKRNGESRRFAFIGFKSLDDAEKAAGYYNKSFIDTARIDVELAKSFADPDVPQSFREKKRDAEFRLREQEERLTKIDEERRNLKRQKTVSSIDQEIENNPKLREYMEVMKPSHMVQSWANDAVVNADGAPSVKDLADYLERKEKGEVQNKPSQIVTPNVPENESDDDYEDFNGKNTHREVEDDQDEEEEEKMISLNDLPAQPELVGPEASDLDWLKARRRHMRDNEETNSGEQKDGETDQEEDGDVDTTGPEIVEPKEHIKKSRQEVSGPSIEEQISETGRLFIRNILYSSTEEDFKELFSKFGNLEEVHIAVDTRNGKSKGFVYVQFSNSEDAVEAYKSLDKLIFQGRLLHILPGQKKKDHRLDEFDLKNLPLKKQKELKRKAQASKTQFNWNSLFMNQDAVMSSVAAKMGVSKLLLIDAQSSDSAVKQALAEASVIGDVKKYFEQKGIDLTSFSKSERDDKVILIKNFPFGTTVEEIGELFAEYGQIKRLLMPPAGTIAIVEFRDIPSARAAFTKLAYKKFKKSIIYLEKGPKDLFKNEPTEEETLDIKKKEPAAVEAKLTAQDILSSSKEADVSEEQEASGIDGPTVSIFVKNLNFSTTSELLSELFKPLEGFAIATVKTKADPKKSGSYLSMGFGFVEFKTSEQASTAIRTLDGHVLDGHKLQLKMSHRQGGGGNDSGTKKSSKGQTKSSKIIIKNLPFEATRKDVVELFGAFGNLKSVRVPRKFDKSVRGFAFVEFTLLKEAENAMTQLEGVHLLGRRLVMQFAEQEAQDAEEEIEKMTAKAKKQKATRDFQAAKLTGKGKKFQMEDEEDVFA